MINCYVIVHDGITDNITFMLPNIVKLNPNLLQVYNLFHKIICKTILRNYLIQIKILIKNNCGVIYTMFLEIKKLSW